MTGQTVQQLTLNVHLRDDATLENYLPLAETQVLLRSLTGAVASRAVSRLFLSTVRSIAVALTYCRQLVTWPEAMPNTCPWPNFRPTHRQDVFQGIETLKLVCLDDLQAVLGRADWEQELFHLFNRARDNQCRLLVSADAAPRALSVSLADLQSRLGWGIVYRLPAISDEQREQLLVFRASRRGLQLAAEVASYIVSRAPRAMDSLLDVLNTLDKASLAQQRPLSIPFCQSQRDSLPA